MYPLFLICECTLIYMELICTVSDIRKCTLNVPSVPDIWMYLKCTLIYLELICTVPDIRKCTLNVIGTVRYFYLYLNVHYLKYTLINMELFYTVPDICKCTLNVPYVSDMWMYLKCILIYICLLLMYQNQSYNITILRIFWN